MPALPALRHTFQKLLCRFFGSSTLSISANHFPPLIPLSRLLSIESVQTPCSTHAHLALRASLSCLGSFSVVTADKFSSLIFFPSQSIFLRPLGSSDRYSPSVRSALFSLPHGLLALLWTL